MARPTVTRSCPECNGSGKLTQLGGDWAKNPERHDIVCWRCNGAGILLPKPNQQKDKS